MSHKIKEERRENKDKEHQIRTVMCDRGVTFEWSIVTVDDSVINE